MEEEAWCEVEEEVCCEVEEEAWCEVEEEARCEVEEEAWCEVEEEARCEVEEEAWCEGVRWSKESGVDNYNSLMRKLVGYRNWRRQWWC